VPTSTTAACAERADGYERRRPEDTLLHRVVREHWPAFLARAEEEGGLPRFVVRELDESLRCGIGEHGVAHLACEPCGHALVVAFSCKRRGFCPSCTARRMADVAAFVTAIERSLRRRAKKLLGLRSIEHAITGAITFVQRGDSALFLNLHAHVLVLDGVYVRGEDGVLAFHALPPPSAEDVRDVARRTHAALVRVLARSGFSRARPGSGRAGQRAAARRMGPRAPLRRGSLVLNPGGVAHAYSGCERTSVLTMT